MDFFTNQLSKQFPKLPSPVQSMEGSSFQIQADYTNRNSNSNQTPTASLKINVQTLKVSTANHHATDDTAMSGLDYPMSGIVDGVASHVVKPKFHSSINTGDIQQQAEMARMLQPTIRALQSATDKAINHGAKAKRLPRVKKDTSHPQKNLSGDDTVTVADTKSKMTRKEKKKKNDADGSTQPNHSTEGSVKKTRKRKPKDKNKGGPIADTLSRRQKSDAALISKAERSAQAKADKFKKSHAQAPNPRDWQTVYEQEYQARTARLRARQFRDEEALMSALHGLSLGGSKDTGDDHDSIL
ncbi:hypothetical protein DSL72_004292 [Monilinia vaccinii-corymbosi]|uniref:Uncharacterized protein n=1 Tax=Monilinia vaccinii-corymbosi TaxID=61207 RepID=A0A8A3NVN9_9HELO|nr:hypothetical protein DSL72_004292 [Monilinia vaccinii-corymbosi]